MRMRGLLVASAVAATSVLAACTHGGPENAARETVVTPATPEATPAPSGSTTLHPDSGARPDGWPAEAALVHGADVWAVYLAVGPAGDPELAEAAEYLESRGYSAGVVELGCDEGAAEALRRDPQELAVAAYFDWRADAGDFLAMLKPPGSTPESSRGFVELLRVTRFCLD